MIVYVIYHNYDLIGRVEREIHELPMLKRFKHDKFEMSYLYDAVSGKVKEMIYNKGKKDEFRHRFAYDAMGNLKYVWTSRDGKHWLLESALRYYPDGKLMRREIRPNDLMLRGLDYAYTLDGWLKAINSEVLENDPSKDGISGTYEYFARDVFSLLLRYYPNDYKPIKPTAIPLEASIVSGNSHLYKPYYTGWISSWSLHLDTLHTGYSFRYDRLGRLTKATTLTGFNGTEWSASLTKNYSTKYSYDLVGNILSLTRYGSDTNAIDVLTYEYYNRSRNNRLKRIVDGAGRMIGIDLDTQPMDNYRYDPVGNMIEDKSRNMQVFYTYSNKPKFISFGGQRIRMLFNPGGYRFFKGSGNNKGDIFVYNSQGQLMAKYEISGSVLKLDFMPIYEGTKRLGILEISDIEWLDCPQPWLPPCNPYRTGLSGGRLLQASRKYELTDHLNNVRVVIRDQRVPMSQNGNTVAYYKPLVHEISDYYPYGWQKFLGKYEFGANAGSLFEDWDSTRGTYYTLYRLLDARVARWYQVEPKIDQYGMWSGYVVNMGNPSVLIDMFGSDTIRISKDAKGNWQITDVKWVKGNDVFIVDYGDTVKQFVFSEGEYGKRVNILNLEIDSFQTFGVYHLSGSGNDYAGVGYVISPGSKGSLLGKRKGKNNTVKRLGEGVYKLSPSAEAARWKQVWITHKKEGDKWKYIAGEGIKIHFALLGPASGWTLGCFVITARAGSYEQGGYQRKNGFFYFDPIASLTALIVFDYYQGATEMFYYGDKKYRLSPKSPMRISRLGARFDNGLNMNLLIIKDAFNY